MKPNSPAVQAAITWLTRQQCSNGLFEAYRSNPTVACVAADPNTFTGPDTNSSGMAIQGLAAYGKRPLGAQALASFASAQSSDGGWPFVAKAGQASDPDSTALVMQALLSEKSKPTSSRWVHGTASPLGALAKYQLGCNAPAANRGAFFFPGSSDPSVLATVQAVPAAALKRFPLAKTHLKKAAAMQCPA